jgi:hypothetical protein
MEEYDSAFDTNSDDDTVNDAVGDILSQLQESNGVTTQNNAIRMAREKDESCDKDSMEEFIIEKTSKLISKTLSMVDNVSDYISSAPENRDVASIAELIRASTSAIDTLQRMHITAKNNDARKEIKTMDIEARIENNVRDNHTKIAMSREEVMEALLKDSEKVVTSKDKEEAIEMDD